MARIIAPNKEYNGVSAGVRFCNGQAECSDKWTIDWFKAHGYTVKENAQQSKPELDSTEPAENEVGEAADKAVGAADDETADKPDNAECSGSTEAETQNAEKKADTKSTVKSKTAERAKK